jgi:hypothetical protein
MAFFDVGNSITGGLFRRGPVRKTPTPVNAPIEHPVLGGVRQIIPRRTHQPVRIARPVRHPVARPIGTQTGTVARPFKPQF